MTNASRDLHNENCFRFLQCIAKSEITGLENILNAFLKPRDVKTLMDIKDKGASYDSKISYADLYHHFLSNLEHKIDSLGSYQALVELLNLIFVNDNHNLAASYQHIQGSLSTRRLYQARPEALVKATMAKDAPLVSHQHTPQKAGSKMGLMISNAPYLNFKPMLTTSLPTIRRYSYMNEDMPTELRFGTQAQRHQRRVRLSPLFRQWVEYREKPHVYFNLLGYDRSGYLGRRERELSLALLASEKEDKLYVIVLPSDKGLMNKSDFKKTKPSISRDDARSEMLQIAMGTSTLKVKDFVVSDLVKHKLYAGADEDKKLNELLDKSFERMGLSGKEMISPAEKQAVWFDFCKFQFPNFVLDTLKPATWNASCKDAIDRGGVASAYYNLMKALEQDNSFSRDEFEQGLHAAAAMVKGRGLNHHYEIVWNAVNHYVNANHKDSWLIHWRNDNTPILIAQDLDYVKESLKLNRKLLEDAIDESNVQTPLMSSAKDILTELLDLLNQNKIEKKDGPLALELISHVTQLAFNPKHHKRDLPQIIEDLGQRPIFTNILQRFLYWLKDLFISKSESGLASKIGQFKEKLSQDESRSMSENDSPLGKTSF